METRQEVEVWYVLPSIRKNIVLYLQKKGLKQKEIAKYLNLTEAAVSQYLKNKRGNVDLSFFEEEIIKSAENILKKHNPKEEIQKLLKKLEKTKKICLICREKTNSSENCEICW